MTSSFILCIAWKLRSAGTNSPLPQNFPLYLADGGAWSGLTKAGKAHAVAVAPFVRPRSALHRLRILCASSQPALNAATKNMMPQKYCSSIICIASSPRTAIAAPQVKGPRYMRGPHIHHRRPSQKLLIAASDSADTPIISLDGHSPAVAATPIPSVVVAIASIMPVVRPTDINSEATSFKVHALSESRRRCSGHRAQQSECDQRFRNPCHRVPSFLFRPFP